jgi:hypothetical protein
VIFVAPGFLQPDGWASHGLEIAEVLAVVARIESLLEARS